MGPWDDNDDDDDDKENRGFILCECGFAKRHMESCFTISFLHVYIAILISRM